VTKRHTWRDNGGDQGPLVRCSREVAETEAVLVNRYLQPTMPLVFKQPALAIETGHAVGDRPPVSCPLPLPPD
jgi:hypothetical protein